MRYVLAFIVCWVWLCMPQAAHAQGCGPTNPNCVVPTAPTGTSDNRAASTAFVQNQIPVINVMSFGAKCDVPNNVDDSIAINNALNAAKVINQNQLIGLGAVTVQFPPDRQCLFRDTLNMTGKRSNPANGFSNYGVTIRDANLFCASTGKPCIDALGALGIEFQNFRMVSVIGSEPTIGIQIGTIDSANIACCFTFNNIIIRGSFSQAAYYNYGSEETTLSGSFDIFNNDVNGYTVVLDGWNSFLCFRAGDCGAGSPTGITSQFQTQTLTANTFLTFQGNYLGPGRIESLGAQSIWIAGAGQLTFKGTYANVAPGGCNVQLYFNTNISFGNLNGSIFDMHFEANELDTFCLNGRTATTPQITNFRFSTENATQATNSIFKIIGTSPITSVTLYDLDMSVSIGNATVRVFDDPTKWTVTGRVAINSHGTQQPLTAWNIPKVWSGQLCINAIDATYTGGYCNFTSTNDANGPTNGIRTRSTASNGSNDFSLYAKSGVQGYPVATFQGWGTAGATAGKIGVLAITTAGTLYVPGTYTNVPLTNVSSAGVNGNATIVVGGGGTVTAYSFNQANTSNNLGTGYKPGDTLSANNASLGGAGSGLVLTVVNNAARQALDIFPLGYQLGDDSNGSAWFDVCNNDAIVAQITVGFICFHPTAYLNGDVGIASSPFSQARRRLMFGDLLTGYQNWIYSNDDFHTLQGNVRGTGTALVSSIGAEDASKNLLLQSNNWGATWVLTNVTQGASGVEDPWGGTSATLLTQTAGNGTAAQNVTVPNDSATYTASIYVNAASVSTLFEWDIIFNTGGTPITYRAVIIPSSGSLGFFVTAPTGCLNNDGGTTLSGVGPPPQTACYGYEKIVVGCPAASGCSGTGDTWYRFWLTGSNNSTGNVNAQVRIIPLLSGTSSAIVAGAQLEVGNRVTPYIPTTTAAVQRRPGPIATKAFYTSNSATSTGAGATNFYAVGCGTAAQTCQGVFVSSGTVRNLFMTVQTAPGGGQTYTNTLMAGTGATPGATTVTCTISGAGATTCNDITNAARIAAGDTFDVRVVGSAGAGASGIVTFGFELWTP